MFFERRLVGDASLGRLLAAFVARSFAIRIERFLT